MHSDSDVFFAKNKIKVVNFFDLNKKSEILFDKPIIYNTNNN